MCDEGNHYSSGTRKRSHIPMSVEPGILNLAPYLVPNGRWGGHNHGRIDGDAAHVLHALRCARARALNRLGTLANGSIGSAAGRVALQKYIVYFFN